MGWLEDFIETLPAEYEDVAKTYLPALKKMKQDELLAWLDYLRKQDEQQVYAMLVKHMTTEEIVADGDRGNELLKALNKAIAQKVNMGWHLVFLLISASLEKHLGD